ncbi:MAG: FkbM family methyltransferase [Flavobacterium sp.]|nr:MAG: FkbM family methyltransferase [Flavobacterium sp.]
MDLVFPSSARGVHSLIVLPSGIRKDLFEIKNEFVFLLRKLLQFQRFPLERRVQMLIFQLQKTMGMDYSHRNYALNTFLTTHLLRYNGWLKKEEKEFYTTDFFFATNDISRITLRKKPSSDFLVFDQVFVLKEYQHIVNLMLKTIDPSAPLKIIDAGANIGLASLYFMRVFKKATICLVEPDPANFDFLKKNIEQNKINSILINGGVWSHDTYLQINRDFRDGNDWSVNVTESPVFTTVKGYSIPTLMHEAGFQMIDLLKIDIEGAEKQLFNNEKTAGEFLSKTRFICIEIHDECNCRNKIYECLTKNQFNYFERNGLTFGINQELLQPNIVNQSKEKVGFS